MIDFAALHGLHFLVRLLRWLSTPFLSAKRSSSLPQVSVSISVNVLGLNDLIPLVDTIFDDGLTQTDSKGYIIIKHKFQNNESATPI